MPRGPLSGATAALISATAERGVQVSRYQIERWRAAGDLPRPVRHGQGRGHGVTSEPPDEDTIQRAIALAKISRRGSRRYGTHPVERAASRQPVTEAVLRQAIDDVLADTARMLAADITDPDTAWQARHDIATRIPLAHATPFNWQELLDAAEHPHDVAPPSRTGRRSALAGAIHALGGGSEVLGEDLIDFLSVSGNLDAEQADQLRQALRDAELSGDDVWDRAAEAMSIQQWRRLAAATDMEQWTRALPVVATVGLYQIIVATSGALAFAGQEFDFGGHIRIDQAVIRRLQANPMWATACTYRISPKPKQRVRSLVLTSLALITAGGVEAMEAYLACLVDAIHPHPPVVST